MAENSKIEWTDHTFNPWVGCTKVSPGCDHCYAESWAKRAGKSAGVTWGGERRRTSAANWEQPRRWNAQAHKEGRRYRVFCSSLADVFDNQVPAQWRAELFALIDATPNLDWLLLTKRIGNVREMVLDMGRVMRMHNDTFDPVLPRNVWLGATIVNQQEADRDIPKLLAVPARVRFLSIEPLLGPVDLRRLVQKAAEHPERGQPPVSIDALRGWYGGAGDPASIDWVIVGGESGPGARPMSPDWARSLRDQCARAGVPFLFKQWGEWLPMLGQAEGVAVRPKKATTPDGWVMGWAGKKAAGRRLDGAEHSGFPEVSHV
jgi:protein gp37